MMENPIEMDDLGVPLFSETSIYLSTNKNIPYQSHDSGGVDPGFSPRPLNSLPEAQAYHGRP